MRSSSARCFASNGEGGSDALGALVAGVALDDLLPNSAENGNRLGVCRVSVAALSVAALSVAGLAAAGGGAVPVFGNGAGTGSGTFPLPTGSAEAEDATGIATGIATTIAATIVQHKPITARQRMGATAIRPDLVGRFGAIIPLPPMRSVRTPRYARPPERTSLNARYGKFATELF